MNAAGKYRFSKLEYTFTTTVEMSKAGNVTLHYDPNNEFVSSLVLKR
jgi:hypothetical protein